MQPDDRLIPFETSLFLRFLASAFQLLMRKAESAWYFFNFLYSLNFDEQAILKFWWGKHSKIITIDEQLLSIQTYE